MRRRLRRGPQGAQVPHDRDPGADRPEEPPAPGRVRLRAEHGRRGGHPDPDARSVPPAGVRPPGHSPPRRGRVRVRPRVPAAGDRSAPPGPGAPPLDRRARGPASPRLARRPHRRRAARRDGALGGARHQAGLRGTGPGRPGPAALRAEALHHPEALREGRRGGRRARADVRLPAEPLVQHADLQGHAERRPDRVHVPGRDGSRRRVRAGARAPAVQHQHVPVLAARASLPVRRAQRRDQHPPGQHQLDARPGGAVPLQRVRRRAVEGPARHARRAVGLGHLRQRPRVPGHERALPAPRDPDDDPGAVAEARVDEPGPARLLRVPLRAHGALGRPGVDRLHRRDGDRGDPRPERAPAVALLRDEGRSGRHGLRGRRAGHPAGGRADQGAPAPGPDLPGGHGARPDRRRRGDQGRARGRAPLRRLAPREHRPARRPAEAQGAPAPITTRSSSGRSRSDTRTRTSGSCWRRWRARARKRSARWAPTRRSPSCRTGRGRSTTTSSSCSPRSRTLPWTRSGRSS